MDWNFQIIANLGPLVEQAMNEFSGFFRSEFFSALAGAAFGALAADRIATRRTRCTKLGDAVRDTNTAIMFAAITSNQALSLKSQHVLDFHIDFCLEEIRFQEEARRRQEGRAATPNEFRINAYLNELPEINVPVEALASIVFNSLRLNGRPIGLMVAVQNALQDLNDTMRQRNEFCQEFTTVPDERRAAIYFGFPHNHVVDQRYTHYVNHIYSKTNDLAFFAAKLCDDLQRHGKKLAERAAKECRKEEPLINEMKFDTPLAQSLMPPEAQYQDFLSMFREVTPVKSKGALKRAYNDVAGWVKARIPF